MQTETLFWGTQLAKRPILWPLFPSQPKKLLDPPRLFDFITALPFLRAGRQINRPSVAQWVLTIWLLGVRYRPTRNRQSEWLVCIITCTHRDRANRGGPRKECETRYRSRRIPRQILILAREEELFFCHLERFESIQENCIVVLWRRSPG